MSIVEHVSLLPFGTSSGYKPRRDIAGSSNSTMLNYLRNRQTDFQSGCNPPGDTTHNKPPNTDIIAYASKILLTGPWYSCLLRGYDSVCKYRSGCSQSSIGWNTGSPRKELEKVPMELKGSL
jgi:hypothetical protein